jgi:hypothetical protein
MKQHKATEGSTFRGYRQHWFHHLGESACCADNASPDVCATLLYRRLQRHYAAM